MNDNKFNYMLLDRLKGDCDYYLGVGGRNNKHLWANNPKAQIEKMKELYNSLEDKPTWLTYEQIIEYERLMCVNN
ncbi:MAG: LPD11 domain-containing protein [Clostridium butyricum]